MVLTSTAISMLPIVEANSLGTLTNLASNPPLYPRNPTETPRAPLTLYVVRVPGSRDVFLTPLKPREKVVNAQDVQSSLYFLHVDSHEDEFLSAEEDRSETPKHGSLSPSSAHVARKPLPTPPVSPPGGFQSPRGSDELTPEAAKRLSVPARKPVAASRTDNSSADELNLPEIPLRSPRRKPLLRNRHSPLSNSYDDEEDEQPPSLPRRPLNRNRWSQYDQVQQSESDHSRNIDILTTNDGAQPRLSTSSQNAQNDRGVSLTLIRRDPSSGAQWNVARIHDPPVHEVSSFSSDLAGSLGSKKNSGAPMFLEVSNPGYTKFIQIDQARPVSRGSSTTSSTDSDLAASAADGIFRRRMWLEGSRYADHSYGHRKFGSQDLSAMSAGARPSLQISTRQWQSTSKAIDRRSKGYAFRSPWNGKCEFSTGTTGRALKCKHTLEATASHQEITVGVSELRFNLPTSGPEPSPSPGVTEAKRSSYFAHQRTSSEMSDDFQVHDWTSYRDERGNIDLSLGQELAGGGLGGKQAKMGKLIVEDEGQKMLDLIVAANMALWWRAYERT